MAGCDTIAFSIMHMLFGVTLPSASPAHNVNKSIFNLLNECELLCHRWRSLAFINIASDVLCVLGCVMW